jgi:amino acid transporter
MDERMVSGHGSDARLRTGDGAGGAGLGTFLGVFLPTILTILGVMMYLRLGAVVGHAGLGKSIGIILIANAITLITAFSFSSVATNIRVGVGGAYYIISRSLGLETGGAIGLPLFLSQAFSVTLYAYGLAEAATLLWPALPVQPAAFVIVLLVAGIAYAGPKLALRIQVPLLVFIGVSLLALFIGVVVKDKVTGLQGELILAENPDFWGTFAVFFPAVTGVMAGLGLSGDLRDPGKSIPVGALSATLVGLCIYLLVPVLLYAAADREALSSDSLIWTKIAPLGAWFIFPGLLGAIFSSAVGSILGAPRTLQALALDRIAPAFLARAENEERGPVFGLFVSTAIALGAVFLGDLNAVALVVTMFFLTVYGSVNLVAALETVAGDPSWRPKLRIPWLISLLGGLACGAVMFLISPTAAIVAIVAEAVLFFWLARRERRGDWGDARRGAYEALIRWSLVKLRRHPMQARSWRPHVLVYAGNVEDRITEVRFGNWFARQRGVVTVCELVVGDLNDETLDLASRKQRADDVLKREGLIAFPEVLVVRDIVQGLSDVAQANGIAGMESNLIVMGWPEQTQRLADFLVVTRRLEAVNKSIVVAKVHGHGIPSRSHATEIHVWWGGLQRNGDLMLLLAHLLQNSGEWRHARIKVLSVVRDEEERQRVGETLAHLIDEIRIDADAQLLLRARETPIADIIRHESRNASAVFLGLLVPDEGTELTYAERLAALAEGLPVVFFVKNSSLFVGELV